MNTEVQHNVYCVEQDGEKMLVLKSHEKEKTTKPTPQYDLYSFDIFDTLITRTTATPKGIFAIMQDILQKDSKYQNIPEFIRRNFFNLRVQFELQYRDILRRNYEKEDIDINFLYEQFAENYRLSEEDANLLKLLELETEYKNILPIPQNIDKVKNLVNKGARVVLISDMYLTEEIIRSFLCKCDSVFENIPIYVSSAYGKGKGSKGLYKIVQENEKVKVSKWLHCGDNVRSDINSAKQFGIRVQQYKYIELEEYERQVIRRYENNTFIQLAIGASKNARLFTPKMTAQKRLGCSYVACLYLGYVEWLISEAQRQGINRLYFLARDGYLLQKMFDTIVKTRGIDIKTKYIYGSRAAWRLPAISEVSIKDIIAINWTNNYNLQILADTLDIDEEELLKFLPLDYSKTQFTQKDLIEIANILDSNTEFKNFLISKTEKERELIKAYFEQEIDFSDENYAIVELQGSGFTIACLKKILGNENIKSFYMRFNSQKDLYEKNFHSWFSNVNYLHYFTEVFLRAPHGGTLGYKYDETGKVVPILDDTEGDAIIKWGFKDFADGIEAFSKFYALNSESIANTIVSDVTLYCEYFNYMKTSKNSAFANLVGSIPFIWILYTNSQNAVFLQKYRTKELLKDFILGRNISLPPRNKMLANLYYARCSNNARKIWDLQKEYKSLRKYIINIETNRKLNKAELCILGKKFNFQHLLWRKNK